MWPQNHESNIEVEAGETAQWIINVVSHPVAKLKW